MRRVRGPVVRREPSPPRGRASAPETVSVSPLEVGDGVGPRCRMRADDVGEARPTMTTTIEGTRALPGMLCILIGAFALVACDSPGGGGKQAIVSDVFQDVANGDALFPQPDAVGTDGTSLPDSVADSITPDTSTPDTSTPDTFMPETTTSVCSQGCVPAV